MKYHNFPDLTIVPVRKMGPFFKTVLEKVVCRAIQDYQATRVALPTHEVPPLAVFINREVSTTSVFLIKKGGCDTYTITYTGVDAKMLFVNIQLIRKGAWTFSISISIWKCSSCWASMVRYDEKGTGVHEDVV